MKSNSLASLVYSEIRRQILISQLQPNTKLKEDYWAKKLNVSRIAVREALTRLLGEGLVTSGDKGGFFVTEMTSTDVVQIKELREVLELAALRLGIGKVSKTDIEELESICDDFTNLATRGYIAGACEADIKFHETLVGLSRNERLLRAYHFSHIPLFHQKLGKTKLFMDDYALTDKEHRKIVEAIKKKDLKSAEETLKAHFKRGESAVLEID